MYDGTNDRIHIVVMMHCRPSSFKVDHGGFSSCRIMGCDKKINKCGGKIRKSANAECRPRTGNGYVNWTSNLNAGRRRNSQFVLSKLNEGHQEFVVLFSTIPAEPMFYL